MPLTHVSETVEFDRRRRSPRVRRREALVVRERVLPTVHLRRAARGSTGRRRAAGGPCRGLEVGERRSALVVDALLGSRRSW